MMDTAKGKRGVLFVIASVLLVFAILAMAGYTLVPTPRIGCDFDLRFNEMSCVRDGVDPFDVWSGKTVHAPYYPDVKPEMRSEVHTRRVNAYPPWAYTFGMPLTFLPETAAWYLYFAFNVFALLALGFVGFRYAKDELGDADDARFGAVVPLLLAVFAIGSCFMSGNYPIPVLCATLAMIWCLNRGHDILAGFCWALAMIKPQMVLLYAVPLLMRRRFLTCAVAAVTCLVASVLPMILCHKGLVEMIQNGIGASQHAFMGCGTCPGVLIPLFGHALSINVGLAVGLLLCVVLTWKTPRQANWLVFLGPAVYISTAWTYSQLYASVTMWPFLLMLVVSLCRQPRSKALWCIFALSVLFVTRAYTFFHGFTMLVPERFGYSMALHGVIDSLNSLLGLVIFIWFWRVTVMHGREGETA